MTKSTKVVSYADTKFAARPVNQEFEARMRRLYVERAATIEQVQPDYWQEIAAQGETLSGRRIVSII
jgi:hypothetical protein